MLSLRFIDIDILLVDIDIFVVVKFSVIEFYLIFFDVGEVFDIKSYVDVYCRYLLVKYEGVFCFFLSWCVEG